MDRLSDGWRDSLKDEFRQPYFCELLRFLETERSEGDIFPSEANVLQSLEMTPLENVKVVILGQDPYHDEGQAHGLSFSVLPGVRIPPSLRNIYRELEDDLGIAPVRSGYLGGWAKQGVLLLNTVLTVRAHQPNSHRGKGWETFTDRVLEVVNQLPAVCFVLWGNPAQKKSGGITDRHLKLCSAHPSPLSAHRGFFGSRPFSKINDFLIRSGQSAIDWSAHGQG
ncbi:MAG: uracil-DNA glycosylase [Planctomyces sp.]|nr:uracil-DNA glycosylase [Planctomyces sp.]